MPQQLTKLEAAVAVIAVTQQLITIGDINELSEDQCEKAMHAYGGAVLYVVGHQKQAEKEGSPITVTMSALEKLHDLFHAEEEEGVGLAEKVPA